jgi:hypothetical protein
MIALFDYEAIIINQISLGKGDRLIFQNAVNPDWTSVYNIKTEQQGEVPSSYIAKEGALEAEDWYFKETSKAEAENFLMGPECCQGIFLIRPTDQEKGEFLLSVRVSGEPSDHVEHFKIQTEDEMYYISEAEKFKDLQSLVEHYKTSKFSIT